MDTCAILVVDDDPDIRSCVSEILDLQGYPVQTAADGAEALRLVEQHRPGLVLLDMWMPVLDGRGFAHKFRAKHGHTAPILVMTAARDAAHSAAEIGAEGYLAKPFGMDELVGAVKGLCAGGSAPAVDLRRAWRRLLADLELDAVPHPVAAWTLGDYAVLRRHQGEEAAGRAFPDVVAHLEAGCAECADALGELLVFAAEW
jgi:two-component system chemotaxis response regulator CheY